MPGRKQGPHGAAPAHGHISRTCGTNLNQTMKDNTMSKINRNDWQVILKVIIAIATTLFGALGAKEAADNN